MVWLGLTLMIVGFVVLTVRFRRFRQSRKNTRSTWRTSGVPLVMTRGSRCVNPRIATGRTVGIATSDSYVMRRWPRRDVAALNRDILADETWGVARG